MKESTLIHLIPILWKSKKLILGVSLLSGLLMAGIMLTKPNYFKSTSLFYPVHSGLLNPSSGTNSESNYFGDDRDVDRLLSIATSLDLKQELIRSFDLADHYQVDTSSPKGRLKVLKTLNKNLTVFKTQYDAINLSVEDKDPEQARQLTLAAQDYIDKTTLSVIHQSQQRTLDQLERQRLSIQEKLSEVTDSLNVVRDLYGIYSSESQAEALTTLEISNPKSLALRRKIKDYNKGISAVMSLESSQAQLNRELTQIALKSQQLSSGLDTDISSLHVIEKASLPLEKSRPRRSLYVLATMLGMGLLACSLVLIREQLSIQK